MLKSFQIILKLLIIMGDEWCNQPVNNVVFMQEIQTFEDLQHNTFDLMAKEKKIQQQAPITLLTWASVKGCCILSRRLARSCSQYSITRKILLKFTLFKNIIKHARNSTPAQTFANNHFFQLNNIFMFQLK
jgi:hypothetical protein